MSKIIWFVLAVMCSLNTGNACSCVAPNTFCESIIDLDGNLYGDILIRGRVISDTEAGKEIRVQETILGDFNGDQLTLSYGFCTIYYQFLEEGNEYVIAIRRREGENFLIDCSISFLRIINEQVIGAVAPGVTSVSYDRLFESVTCNNLLGQIGFSKDLSIYPNPVIDNVHVHNTSDSTTIDQLQMQIIDVSGRTLATYFNITGISPSSEWQIPVNNHPAGLYFIVIRSRFQQKVYKIVKA